MYSTDHAEIYDFIHAARGRDWAAEADDLAKLILDRRPEARSLLDVACGTGEHLVRFATHFERTEGLELSEGMGRIAEAKLAGGTVHSADMRDFDLGTSYDAIVCMCFSLSYTRTVEELRSTAASMVRHLAPGGVLIAEPWWFPEKFIDGFVSASLAEEEGRAVSRLSHTVKDGRTSRMTVRYTVADRSGIREFTEHEILSLFSEEEYKAAFAEAGCPVEYHPGGPNGRGLFVGVRP
ncbi:SAM-dependent methyltransferase [Streptomyces abyssalis]|uniref:SAM-dependent methyltransferase n=1 Tax=Streptomyces abyssalis TaxID=933944 RepID=A0A1E7JGR8_9ACTN|nr:class I SAM-dependent methyltransferase [Streptomyces abyssalis]OEU85647.1 SAM-dependent methyltransferase [Streptomyces abyssalis]OEU92889.1 SAM-dependent methyltransferase [Streptomyces abyssalis]OEV30515.1 SAM-dependent methyltransferase [Streptomyces nanshensis]